MKILFFYFEKSTALHIFPDMVLLLVYFLSSASYSCIFFITNAVIIIFIIIVLLSLPAYRYNDLNYTRIALYRAIADTCTGRLLLATENTIEYSH